MKKIFSVMLLMGSLVSASASASAFALPHALMTPRPVSPAISTSDHAAVNAYLVSLVEEYEGLRVGINDLHVFLSSDSRPCQVSGDTYICSYGYGQGRWCGDVVVHFALINGNITEMTLAGFGGNY